MAYTPFSIPPGVVRNATSKQTPGRWWNANLVRWRQGIMQPVGGWERLTENPLASTPRAMTGWTDAGDAKYLGVLCDNAVYALQADQVYDITPTGFVGTEDNLTLGGYGSWDYGDDGDDPGPDRGTVGTDDRLWGYERDAYGRPRSQGAPASMLRPSLSTIDAWGNQVLFCSSTDGKIYKYDPAVPTDPATVVHASAPISNRGIIVTPERHVVALGVGGAPRRVGWCSQEDYTDWNFASITNTAGFIDLDTNGQIFTAKGVREGTLLFCETDVFLLAHQGAPYIYGAQKMAENTSIMSPYSVAGYDGKALWMTRSGFMEWNGGMIKPVISDIADYIFKNIDPFWGRIRTHMVVNNVAPEIWIFWPSNGSNECDNVAIWSYEEGWWSMGKMHRTAGIPALVDRFPVMAGDDGHLYYHETELSAFASPGVGTIYAESGSVYPTKSGVTMVTSVLPDSELGAKSTAFTFYGRMTPEGTERVYGPYIPRSDGVMDCRFTARSIRIRVSQIKDGHWTVGEPEYEFKAGGRR